MTQLLIYADILKLVDKKNMLKKEKEASSVAAKGVIWK
jgi:hypothetical protein